ncbi:MAG TPA: hypothetical protein VGM99_04290 [Candidatus Cybelea sp.]|jgi:hypothetical protein
MLVFICAGVALAGAWTDRTKISVQPGSGAVPAAKPWDTIVEISRHGRRLDGFRPVLTITGLSNPRTFHADSMPDGRYKIQVVFPRPGFYQYTVKVADRVAARGQVYAIPR